MPDNREKYAFPLDERNSPEETQWGLTKREWFAGMAIMGMNANPDISRQAAETNLSREEIKQSYVDSAWKQADAMLAASKEKP